VVYNNCCLSAKCENLSAETEKPHKRTPERIKTFDNKKGKRREKEVCICSEHISLRRDREARNMASVREWLPLTAERFSRDVVIRAALV